MQGQRSTVQSLPESFEFDLASNSNNSGMDQQLYWNNVLNPVASRNMQEYIPSSSDTSTTYANAVSHDSGGFTGWNPGGPSSSDHALNQAIHSEVKMEQGWMAPITNHARDSVRLEERRFEPTNILSLESVNIDLNNSQVANGPFLPNSSSDDAPQNAHLNTGFIGNGGPIIDASVFPHPYKPGGSEVVQIPSAGGSANPSATASGTAEHVVDDSDGRPGCSLDSRRLSCKRKALEGVSGSCSLGGSSNCFQRAEISAWHAVPSQQNTASSLSISSPVEHLSGVNPQEELLNPRVDGMRVAPDCHPTLPGDGNVESSQRNFRMRVNPAHQQISAQPNLWSPSNTSRRSQVLSSHQSSSRLLFNQPLGSRPATANATSPQTQSLAPHVSVFPRNMHAFPWNGAPNTRAGSSSNSPGLREESNSRSMARSISEHPMFVPSTEIRHLNQDLTNWSMTNGSISIPGSTSMPGNTSRIGSSSGAHPLPAPTWVPQQHPPIRYPRRLSEAVRRSFFSSAVSESGASSSNFHPPHTAPASSQELLSSGAGHQGHQPSYPRSAFWMDRQGDGVLGVPLSLRALASASEGRSRLASELRNVLELVRRGESLRFEDFMILDQPVIFGVPDLHDRHRDMRLDVDNMSYEELLALEERIGNVSTGLSEETVLKCLKQQKNACIAIEAASEVEPCCICQEEYVEGEDLGTLDCGHDFHTNCIKQWLMHKNICPVCKTTALVA